MIVILKTWNFFSKLEKYCAFFNICISYKFSQYKLKYVIFQNSCFFINRKSHRLYFRLKMNEKTWTIVKFINEEDSIEAVPTTWIVRGNSCYWPHFTHQKIFNAIKNHESPNTDWPTHEVSLFKNGTFGKLFL